MRQHIQIQRNSQPLICNKWPIEDLFDFCQEVIRTALQLEKAAMSQTRRAKYLPFPEQVMHPLTPPNLFDVP